MSISVPPTPIKFRVLEPSHPPVRPKCAFQPLAPRLNLPRSPPNWTPPNSVRVFVSTVSEVKGTPFPGRLTVPAAVAVPPEVISTLPPTPRTQTPPPELSGGPGGLPTKADVDVRKAVFAVLTAAEIALAAVAVAHTAAGPQKLNCGGKVMGGIDPGLLQLKV